MTLLSLITDFWPVLLAALAGIAGLGYRAKVAHDARQDERARIEADNAAEQADAYRKAGEVRRSVDALGPDAVREQLRDKSWRK